VLLQRLLLTESNAFFQWVKQLPELPLSVEAPLPFLWGPPNPSLHNRNGIPGRISVAAFVHVGLTPRLSLADKHTLTETTLHM